MQARKQIHRQRKRILLDLGTGDFSRAYKKYKLPFPRQPAELHRLDQLYSRELKKEKTRKIKSGWNFLGVDEQLFHYKSKNIKLIESEGLSWLKKRKSNSIDIINSDFLVGFPASFAERAASNEMSKVYSPSYHRLWFREIWRTLKPNGRLYLTTNKHFAPRVIKELKRCKFIGIASKEISMADLGTPSNLPKGRTRSFYASLFIEGKDVPTSPEEWPIRIVASKPRGN